MKYLKGAACCGLVYGKGRATQFGVIRYTNSDYEGELEQEAECLNMVEGVKKDFRLNGLVRDIGVHQDGNKIYSDNQRAIHLLKIICNIRGHSTFRGGSSWKKFYFL